MRIAIAGTILIVMLACSSKEQPRPAAETTLEVRTPTGARTWNVADLEKLPRRHVDEGRGRYGGARVTDVLGALPADASVVVRGRDGYTQTISYAAATRDDCLVAFEKDGKRLTAPEGPIRMIVPGSPGLSVHNLGSIELLAAP
jgi:DMSO/TMAO reductase YedYZ molybdopterin-dependent catalytic subunit